MKTVTLESVVGFMFTEIRYNFSQKVNLVKQLQYQGNKSIYLRSV